MGELTYAMGQVACGIALNGLTLCKSVSGTQGAGATILVLGVLSLVMLGMIRGVRR
jgi:MYXO-CTERM domain-containing protein